MRRALPFALALIAAVQLPAAADEVYRWKDGSGRTVISDTPPPPGIKSNRSLATPAADNDAPAPKSSAEKDLEFRKRRQEAREKAEKDGKEQLAAAERKENCAQARNQLAGLETGEPFATRDEKGGRRMMESAERQRESERTRKFLVENCQ